MPKEKSFGKPTTRRYTVAEKEQAVRLVRQARAEGREAGAVTRVAEQLDFGLESVRSWVKDADRRDGTAGPDTQRVVELEAENRELVGELRELRRANDILKRASAFFAAELDRPSK
jgi:transposase-like protein